MKNTIVVDLDGTLADISHRLPLVRSDKPKWEEFYSGIAKDSLNEWCRNLMLAMSEAGFRIVIVSARPQDVWVETEAWLDKNEVPYDDIFLLRRDQKDFTPDKDLKRSWLKAWDKENILFVVDDRQRVVDMWRDEGVTCLQCNAWAEHTESHKDLPLEELAKVRGYSLMGTKVSLVKRGWQIKKETHEFFQPNAEGKARKFLLRQPRR